MWGAAKNSSLGVLANADLEAVRMSPDRRLASLRDVLQPVVDPPPGASLRPGL